MRLQHGRVYRNAHAHAPVSSARAHTRKLSRRERRRSALAIGSLLFTPDARRSSDLYVTNVLTECARDSSDDAAERATTPPLVLARASHALHTPLMRLEHARDALEFVATDVSARALTHPGTSYVIVTSSPKERSVLYPLIIERAHALGTNELVLERSTLAISSPLAAHTHSHVHVLVQPLTSPAVPASVVYLLSVEAYVDEATALVYTYCVERATPVYSSGFTALLNDDGSTLDTSTHFMH